MQAVKRGQSPPAQPLPVVAQAFRNLSLLVARSFGKRCLIRLRGVSLCRPLGFGRGEPQRFGMHIV